MNFLLIKWLARFFCALTYLLTSEYDLNHEYDINDDKN